MTVLRMACIRADDYHHRYLESLLRSRFDVRLVIVEPESEKVRAMRRRHRYRDYVYHLYHRYRRRLTGKDRYRRRYFAHEPRLWALNPHNTLRVPSVNSDAAGAALHAVDVDVVVIIGCSILGKRTLAAAGPLVVNVHGGFLPYYRGNHCFFFAVYDRRLDRVGSTIHRVDAGIDTGNLIEVVRPPLTGDELPEHLYCRADHLAIHRLVGWLEALERGVPLPARAQPAAGRTYRTRDRGPSHDLRYFARRCARRLGLSPAPATAAASTAAAPDAPPATQTAPGPGTAQSAPEPTAAEGVSW